MVFFQQKTKLNNSQVNPFQVVYSSYARNISRLTTPEVRMARFECAVVDVNSTSISITVLIIWPFNLPFSHLLLCQLQYVHAICWWVFSQNSNPRFRHSSLLPRSLMTAARNDARRITIHSTTGLPHETVEHRQINPYYSFNTSPFEFSIFSLASKHRLGTSVEIQQNR